MLLLIKILKEAHGHYTLNIVTETTCPAMWSRLQHLTEPPYIYFRIICLFITMESTPFRNHSFSSFVSSPHLKTNLHTPSKTACGSKEHVFHYCYCYRRHPETGRSVDSARTLWTVDSGSLSLSPLSFSLPLFVTSLPRSEAQAWHVFSFPLLGLLWKCRFITPVHGLDLIFSPLSDFERLLFSQIILLLFP